MPGKVVDASAVAAFLFVEPEADEVARQLEGFELTAPSLLPYEIASVARKKVARHPELSEQILAASERLDDLGVILVDISAIDALRIAVDTGLSTYDASYLSLSRRTGSPLVTLDKKLQRVARSGPRGDPSFNSTSSRGA